MKVSGFSFLRNGVRLGYPLRADTGNPYWSVKQAFEASYGSLDPEHTLIRRGKKHRGNARLERWSKRDSSKRHFKIIRSWKGDSA